MGMNFLKLSFVFSIALFLLLLQTKDEKYHRIIGQQIKTHNDTQDTMAQQSNGLKNPGFEMNETPGMPYEPTNSKSFYA